MDRWDLQLGLALPTNSTSHLLVPHGEEEEEEEQQEVTTDPTTLSLLPLTPHQDEDEDAHPIITKRERSESGENEVVGWPPLANKKVVVRGSRRMYVKVKMEGVGIGRKIDLSMHHSFHTLNHALLHMFGKSHHHQSYQLTYQDQHGQWLRPTKHLPWTTFLNSAHRLKLLRTSTTP
ncbi:hypothetical protein PIB30_008399 [Stylosanthes scabra]|uniref:Auxin-induced protein n=1 Tax=Stylosanthes scabra TaxID=79078 RepID=A0ABU6V341_9FABA|nr:hypothetical protein [Stylosanthes scabra]